MKNLADTIQEHIAKEFDLQQTKGISITCYDQNKKLIMSKTIVDTDKNLEKVINIIYKSFIEKNQKIISKILCHIITQQTPIQNIEERNKQENEGLLIISTQEDKSSIRIPSTNNERNTKQILDATLQKHKMQTYDQLFILSLFPLNIIV